MAKTKSLAATPAAAAKPATKPAAKAATKPAAKATRPATKTPAKPAVKVAAKTVTAAAPKAAKPPKAKLVRDSFTIPKDEYQVLDRLKTRALGLGQPVKKSELLRAGIRALAAMSDDAFAKALAAVPTLKTGRPKSV